jgi:hypothetical protein
MFENKSIAILMNAVLVGILAFLLACVLWMRFSKREGFTSGKTPKDLVGKLKDANNELLDTLNISTYRSSYEEMILELEKWADNSMLNILAQGKVGLDDNSDSIRLFNDIATFKKNTMDLMNVLDKTD